MSHAEGDFRTFTSVDGREMVASLLNVSGDDVTIRRQADGRKMTTKMSAFSKKDCEYMISWEEAQRLARDDSFDIKIRRTTGGSEKSSTASTSNKSWMEGYEITLSNESRGDITDLDVKYIIFMFDEKVAATRKNQGELKREFGNFDLARLEPDGTTNHLTEKFRMQKSQLKQGWYYINGGDYKAEDELAGCWVRVYKDGEMLREVSLPASVARNEEWKWPKAKKNQKKNKKKQ
ncbi:MAG: hypothetical protein AAF065_03415 [Verrucomicrobiota bacterium]